MAGPKDLLPWIYQQGNATRNRLKQLLTDPRAFAGQLEQDAATVMDDSKADTYLAMAMKDPKFAARVYPTEAVSDPKLMQGRALAHQNRLAEAVMGGMTVYHGSPHKWAPEPNHPLGRFRGDRVGTGEGAATYGHAPGGYWAESPAVAGEYRAALAGTERRFEIGGKDIDPANLGEIDKLALNIATRGADGYSLKALEDSGIPEATIAAISARAAAFQRQGAKYSERPKGYLYKADLPDEHIAKMLDWDKPLGQQGPAMRALDDEINKGKPIARENTVATALHYLKDKLGSDSAAREWLQAQGIPGIRYLDQHSRTAGGTSNFVVFDDQLPKIVERK